MKQRFGLTSGPKLWLFKRRRFYQYDGPIDDLDRLLRFATEAYSEAKVQGDIPQEPGLMLRAWGLTLELVEALGHEINKIVMKNEKEVNY